MGDEGWLVGGKGITRYYCGLCPHPQIFCDMMCIFDDLHLYISWSGVNGVRIL